MTGSDDDVRREPSRRTHRTSWGAAWFVACALALGCGGGHGGSPDSGRADSSAPGCTDDLACDNGLFCDGLERCVDGECVLGSLRLCADGSDCTLDRCDEDRQSCVHEAPDDDRDGHATVDCGGDDCDDHDAARFPGNTEACDDRAHDEDCDPATFGYRDGDGDGWPDATCCNLGPDSGSHCGSDCDDTLPAAHPGEAESCDGVDNNCDGEIDEGVKRLFTVDADGDHHGAPGGATTEACYAPEGYAEVADDCDDEQASVHPGASERCDSASVDEDCDGTANPSSLCSCSGSATSSCAEPGVCAAGRRDCGDGSWGACSIAGTTETCNGLDDDCDGLVDEDLRVTCFADADGDGFARAGAEDAALCPVAGRDAFGGCPLDYTNLPPVGASALDCDDGDSARAPAAPERCDAIDNDCDGAIDEGVRIVCFQDNDGDGVPTGAAMQVCPAPGTMACPSGMTAATPASTGVDCDDDDPRRSPGALEVCDAAGVDEDCDGVVNEGLTVTCYADADADGFAPSGTVGITGCPVSPTRACSAGFTTIAPVGARSIDCEDTRANISPAAPEVCDHLDNDCDGSVDEGVTARRYDDGDGDGFGSGVAAMVCPYEPGYSDNDSDCNDASASIYPGNLAGGTDPVCPTGWHVCTVMAVVGSPASSINVAKGCRSPAAGPCTAGPEFWDFDCNGSVDPIWPVASRCVSTTPSSCTTSASCSGTDGYTWDARAPMPPCGLSAPDVAWSRCACTGTGDYGCDHDQRSRSPHGGSFACR